MSEGVPGNPNIVYVATGSGGIFKTINGGMDWTPIFDRQNTISVGDIALEPGNPDVIWVGTGEANPRNSVSFGDGVYKSTDGGKTWKHLGLKDTNTISKVIVHPKNPDIAYVAAVGRVWGSNEERGVFMTTDGGRSWQKTLYIDPSHGASDLEIDRQIRIFFMPESGVSSANPGLLRAVRKRAAFSARLTAGELGIRLRRACRNYSGASVWR
jgi:hypothetical protein